MAILCDDCGKEANYKNMPEGSNWFSWMSDPTRLSDAVLAVPCEDGVIICVCYSCLQLQIDEMTTQVAPPNP